jgi:hypothetical protein
MEACNFAAVGQSKVIYGYDMQILSNLSEPEYLVVLPFNAKDALQQPNVKSYDCLIACLRSMDSGDGNNNRMINDAEALERLFEVRDWLEQIGGLFLQSAPVYNTGYVVEGLTYSGATMKFTVTANYSQC